MNKTLLGCAILAALAPRSGLAQGTAYAHLDINEVKDRLRVELANLFDVEMV